MTTRELIINTADQLIREKGYNAFSFKDISGCIGIKTASIHYHFPTKKDLGVATIKDHLRKFEKFKEEQACNSPAVKLEAFLSVYSSIKAENKVCMVGSLASDLNTVDGEMKQELQVFAEVVLKWVTETLAEGREKNIFEFTVSPEAKALMVISSIMAVVQISRLTGDADFVLVRETILKELEPQK